MLHHVQCITEIHIILYHCIKLSLNCITVSLLSLYHQVQCIHCVRCTLHCIVFVIGRGPKVKIGRINKILLIQLGLYIRKPGEKSLTQKKLILIRGFAFEKNGPCSWENEVKISKKSKMAKNHFSRSYFGS